MSPQSRYVLLVILAALLFGGGVQYGRLLAKPNAPLLVAESPQAGQEEARTEITVHVAGAVMNPGVFNLAPGARVADVVDIASPLPGADLNALNLAALLKDGQKVTVPEKKKEPLQAASGVKAGASQQALPAPGGLINLNTATLQELDTLPGIGPSLSKRIMDYRQSHGPFRVVDDILNVSGIGASRLEQLRPLIRVE